MHRIESVNENHISKMSYDSYGVTFESATMLALTKLDDNDDADAVCRCVSLAFLLLLLLIWLYSCCCCCWCSYFSLLFLLDFVCWSCAETMIGIKSHGPQSRCTQCIHIYGGKLPTAYITRSQICWKCIECKRLILLSDFLPVYAAQTQPASHTNIRTDRKK